MDESPETLRELAQYLRNSTRLFPIPRTAKAFEWLTVKAAQAEDHATAWEADRKRLADACHLLRMAGRMDRWEDAVERFLSPGESASAGG